MTADFGTFLRYFGETVKDPAAVAGQLVKLRLPHNVSWMALASILALTVIAVYLEGMIPGRPEAPLGFGGTPFVNFIFIASVTVIFIFTLYFAGRAIGGTGTFGGTLLVMTWFQAIVFVLTALQMIAALIAPALGGMVAIGALMVQIYCLMHFINVLHGYDSLWKAAGLFAMSILVFAFGLAVVIVLVGGAAATGGV